MRINLSSLAKNTLPAIRDEIVSGKGSRFFLKNGREILDFSSQTLNLNLGHNHPLVIKAVKNQLDKFSYNSSRFINKDFVELSQALVDLTDKSLNKVNVKMTNGSDAVESAIKRARIATKKRKIVSFIDSHHGETIETIALSGKHFEDRFFGSAEEYLYLKADERAMDKLKTLFEKHNDIAAVIAEPIMVNAGVIIHPKDRLIKMRRLCDKYSAALIFDEVQTAFGWLGSIFAYERFGVVPDILALGKGLASGFPLAAVVFKKKYDVLKYGEDEFTYGGHPVSCAVALANLDLLKTTDFKVEVKEKLMAKLLAKFKARGMGLIWAVECESKPKAKRIYEGCFNNGLLLRLNGGERVLTFKPPIIVTETEIKKAIKIFSSLW